MKRKELKEKDLKDFLSDPEIKKVIPDVLRGMMEAAYTTHRMMEGAEFAHVDPQIISDWRHQGYSLFERAAGLNLLFNLINDEKAEANDYVRELFSTTYLKTCKYEDGFKALCRTILATYAPALKKELES